MTSRAPTDHAVRGAGDAAAQRPALSVVVVRFAGGPAIARTLDTLARQRQANDVEVLVSHRADDGPDATLTARFPWVRWIAGDADSPPAALRSVGVLAATGAVVACTEDHCVPADDWCSAMLAAHARQRAVVGGAIDKALPAGPASWAAYLLDYGRYMSPVRAGPAPFLSDCNVSYPRWALDAVAEQWRGAFHETTVHWALERLGVPLLLDPSVVVRQHREVAMAGYLAERREHGRVFARTRVAGLPAMARARLALGSLALPPVLLLRVLRLVRSAPPAVRVPAAAWWPLARASVAWSMGELRGYLGVGHG